MEASTPPGSHKVGNSNTVAGGFGDVDKHGQIIPARAARLRAAIGEYRAADVSAASQLGLAERLLARGGRR